jgi:glycosyltransferase involved in cell wall biosynthesis
VSPLHVCHVFSTFGRGGVELRTASTIGALGSRYRHSILAQDGDFTAAAAIDPRVDVQLVPPPPGLRGRPDPLAIGRLLRWLAPDLVVTYTWHAVPGLIGGLLARVAPIVQVEAGFGSDEAVQRKRRRLLARRVLLKAVVATIVPSRWLERVALAEFGVPRQKLVRIPNGVDTARFRPGRDPCWRLAHGIPAQAMLFGTVAVLRAEKNLDLLLRAFARAALPEAWLVIVGDGNCRADLVRLSRELGIASRVRFAGDVQDPVPCYASFDAFVLSSSTEQMPNALLEAMAVGLPALCTDVGDCREMLGLDGRQVVPPADEVSYAAALRELAGCTGLRQALGRANRQRCLAQYSLERMVERYAQVYQAAVRRTGRSAR